MVPGGQEQGQWMEVAGMYSSPVITTINLLKTSERLELDFFHFSDCSTSPEPHPHGTAKES